MSKEIDENDQISSDILHGIGDILGLTYCLSHLVKPEQYLTWYRDNYGADSCSPLLLGHKLTIVTLITLLYDEIADKDNLDLDTDIYLERALFKGINIHKLRNSCAKTLLLKNLDAIAQGISKANSWSNLSEGLAILNKKVLRPFESMKQIAEVKPNSKIRSLEDAIKYSAMAQLYIFLNDTSTGMPHGYRPPTDYFDLETNRRSPSRLTRFRGKAFQGYKFSVQYLWSTVLHEEFCHTPLMFIHKSKNWDDFDGFFEIIRKDFIVPLEAKVGSLIAFNSLVHLTASPSKIMKKLIESRAPEPRLSSKDSLMMEFLWYPIQCVDCSALTFSGIPSFVPLLKGMATYADPSAEDERIRVIKVIHPDKKSPVNHFSYAVLIWLHGSLGFSDRSGWTLFYNCCYDTGSGLKLYEYAEKHIQELLDSHMITITVMVAEKGKFLSMINSRLKDT